MNDVSAGFEATSVSRPREPQARALCVAILAMGGEGGGVLADWLVDLAEHAGWYAQTTSVPGVAQRTGATIYYVEIFPAPAAAGDDALPVLALMPVPGEVDVVIASELMEAGRAVQRGLVTPERTTLIASTHRVYSMTEKTAMGDGRVDAGTLLAVGDAAARRFLRADFASIAERHQSVISASLFGALAASGTLPFTREAFEQAIRRAGVGVTTSLAAFAAGFDAALGDAATRAHDAHAAGAREALGSPDAHAPLGDAGAAPTATTGDASGLLRGAPDAPAPGGIAAGAVHSDTLVADATAAERRAAADAHAGASAGAAARDGISLPLDAYVGPRLRALAERAQREFPAPALPTILTGIARLADYQDVAYAAWYIERLRRHADLEARHPTPGAGLLEETARGLALWMSYEDTVRVADLKTRRSRFERVRDEVRANDRQVLEIREFLHPRVEEIADTLPAALGRWLLATAWARGLVARFSREGRVVSTTSLGGYLLLYGVAALRRVRRRSLRYALEQARIGTWLDEIARVAPSDPALAREIAACQRLVKGYGETHARGTRNFDTVMSAVARLVGRADAAGRLRALREAALADEEGAALARALATMQQEVR